ncbi:MAG: DUF2309 domain-containing protein, partial [Gemmataceae bacterium]|nr:DUF2309 domain-containing protein [Gemmataceae bacterium]
GRHRTRLTLERTAPEPGEEGGSRGYSLDEMADVAERQLKDWGMVGKCAPLVLVLGHGSESLNNPHESAHDCGACGGSAGGANGRAVAAMLNDVRVRQRLAARGLEIPSGTRFVGGLHNTADDHAELYDLDLVPDSHRALLEGARRDLAEACRRNAHERCRRFRSAPLDLSSEEALAHVEQRAHDLAETRPEWGHASNALCIVGRRGRTRGLFLDRRSFLVSYDASQDGEGSPVLTRILSAVVPVCGGISLEYYFSHVDNSGFGCGSKLPHNITALLGVMDGAASDLRTGLPWQMVEIHEPVRILFIVEAAPEALLGIMDRNPAIAADIRNGWVQLAVLDPSSAQVRLFDGTGFRDHAPEAAALPRAASSVDWYRGWRDHLDFALAGGGAR